MARVYDNYSSLIDFTRASSGTALRPISYGDELVTNGTFDSDLTGWNNSASIPMDTFELSSGRLHIVNTSGLAQAAYTDDTISLVAGRVYQFSADLEKVGGTDDWDIDIRTAAQSTVRHTMTIYATTEKLVVNFYPTVTENVVIQITTRSAFEGYADNISIREVLFDQPNGTLTLFNHPTNVPRIEYDADGNRLGLLVEESRTNLVDYSEDFSGWNKTAGGAVTQNQALAPDGTLTADEIVGVVYKTPNLSTGTRCLSAYLKANAGTTAQVRFDTPTSNRVVVDLTDGSIVFTSGDSIDSYGVTYIGNGWYRCHIVITDVVNNYVIVAEANDANHTVYVWGAQLEQASFPTSYIPTSGSTATRSADVASIGVSEFGYNQSEGTLFVEYVGTKDTFAGVAALQVDASTVTDRISILQTSATTIESVVSNNSTTQSQQFQPSAIAGQISKAAIAFEANRVDSSFDGSVETTDTSVVVPDEIGILRIAGYGSAYELNSHIKSIKYYPRALTATQIQELTS